MSGKEALQRWDKEKERKMEQEVEKKDVVGRRMESDPDHKPSRVSRLVANKKSKQQEITVRSHGSNLRVYRHHRRQGGNPLLASRSPFGSLPLLLARPHYFLFYFFCCSCCYLWFSCVCGLLQSGCLLWSSCSESFKMSPLSVLLFVFLPSLRARVLC